MILLAVMLTTAMQVNAQRRISIFFDHVAEIAKQERISIKEAAERVRKLGYEGIDVTTVSDSSMPALLPTST